MTRQGNALEDGERLLLEDGLVCLQNYFFAAVAGLRKCVELQLTVGSQRQAKYLYPGRLLVSFWTGILCRDHLSQGHAKQLTSFQLLQ